MDVLSQILKDLASLATTKLLAAILAAVLVVAVGKILLRLLRRSVGKTKMDTTLQKFLISAVKVVIYFVAAMIVAGSLGFEMSSLVALASVVSAAFALAASDTLSNLFGGILLLMTKPFGVNDYVSISGQEGTVQEVGLLNTKIPVTLACVLINVPLIIWFLISFFQDLPEEVEESAKVDGATEWQLFCRIVLPLVAPGIAAVAMLSFMYAWNEYTYTVIFTRTAVNNTVPLALALLNTEDNLTNFGLVAAGGVVSVIPITLFVIFAQNYLISGLSSGAVKE